MRPCRNRPRSTLSSWHTARFGSFCVSPKPVWHIPRMNRHLVEQATHPERLGAIEDELRARDADWAGILNHAYSTGLAARQQADLALLDRNARFTTFAVDPSDHFATRLGAKDLLIALPNPIPGPFGAMLDAIKIPHFLAPDVPAEAVTEVLNHGSDGLVFRLGNAVLRYDRFGLQRTTG